VARWNSFAALTAAELANDDVLPVSDTSAVEGSRSRVVQLGSLKLARVRSYAANFTLDDDLDLGAHVRVTAVATVTIPADLPVGWSCVIENATVGDVVDLAEALGVTLLSAGVSVSPGKWVGLQVVNTDVVSAVGAFTEEAAAVENLTDLLDVDTTGVGDGDVLTYDLATTTWVAAEPTGGDGDVVGPAESVDDRVATFDGITGKLLQDSGATIANLKTEAIIIACSDETTALTAAGNPMVTFRMPYAMTLTAVRASVTTAPTGSVLTVDINEAGTSILSTKLTIDATEKTSTTAATAAVISDTSLANDAEITIDIDGVGSTVAGAGLKVTLIGVQA